MTGLKDRQRLALYVALGLSAGSGLTLDASTAYANPDNHVTVLSTDPDFSTKYASGINATNETHSVKDNVVTIGRKSPVDTPAINGDVVGGYSNAYAVTHNTVTVDDMTLALAKSVFGGLADGDKAVDDNEVTINGGTFAGSNAVYGGKSDTGTATNNTVTIAGGTFSNANVAGGAASTGTTSNHNRVVLGSDHGVYTADLSQADIWGTRYSGDAVVASGNAAITGNTLTVNAQNVTVNKVRNFEKYQFNLNQGVARDASMLTVADANGFGTGANVAWSNIEFSAKNWTDVKNGDGSHTHYGKSGVQTLIQTSDGNQHLVIHNETASSLTRTDLSGDFEYHLATDPPAAATVANGSVSVAKVTAEVNRIQNANAVYDAMGTRPADADNAVRGGYSAYGNTVKDNALRVTNLPTSGLDAAYGGEVAGLAGDVLKNTLTITSTLDRTPAPGGPHRETLTNAYGGAITNAGNNGTVGGLGENEGNRIMASGETTITNLYAGYTAGTGNVQGNLAAIGNGTVISKSYGGYSDHATGTGTVEHNGISVDGGTLTDVYGGASAGSGAVKDNAVSLNGGTADNAYGGFATGSGKAIGNSVEVDGATVTGAIYGANTTNGEAKENDVTISGGAIGTATARGTITGAQTADGLATGNSVTLTGGVLHANVYAAKTTGNGTAQGNFISLGDDEHRDLTATATTDFSDANLYGADLHSASTSSGNNDLKVYAKNVAVHLVSGFNNYRFDIARGITDGTKMLTITQDGFGSAIDGSQIKIENKEKLMEKGNPGGRITLVQGDSSNPLRFTNNTNKRIDLTNQDGYKNIEYVLELSPDTLDETTEAGVSKAEALLLTYAKFKDNVWNYDATQDPSERNEIFGGISYYKNDTDNNNLTVDGVKKDLEAAYGGKTNGLANATNNHVVIKNTNTPMTGVVGKIKKVIGGYTQAPYTVNNDVETAGVAAGNEAVVYGGEVSEGLYGGYAKGNKGKARSNKAIVGGGTVATVYGGLATENGGEATENQAEIYGGTVTNVYGGAVDKSDAAATKNKVQVRGGTVTGEIAGARAVYDTTPAATHTLSNGNNVMLGSEEPTRALGMNVAGTSIYGTDYRDVTPSVAGTPELTFDSASDQIKDNKLIVTTTGVSAKKVRNFDSYIFTIGNNFKNDDTMLTLTEAGGFGRVSNAASNPAVKVDWGKVKANTSKLTDRRGGGIHGRNNFTLMQEAVPGTGGAISYPNELAFANYTDTAGIAEIDRVYEKKMTADVAPAGGSTDTSANKVLLELNRFRNDEVTHKGTEAQTPTEVYGGYSGYDHTERDKDGHDITVGTTTESNILNITGVANGTHDLKAFGGYSAGAHGGSVNNIVNVDVDELPNHVASGELYSVYGGYAKGANAGIISGNTVRFSQGATLKDLMGGYIDSTNLPTGTTLPTSDVVDNHVIITGGKVGGSYPHGTSGAAVDYVGSVYGGRTDGTGNARENTVYVNSPVVMSTTTPTERDATIIVDKMVGGYGATATDNDVTILSGTVQGTVYGGYATTAGTPATTGTSPTAEISALSNNSVTIGDKAEIKGDVYGAYAAADASNMTAATDSNTIDLYKAVIDGTLYGGMARDAAGHDVVSGKNNTLAVHARGAKADDFVGVQNLHFYVPAGTTAADKETMLTLDNVAGAAAGTPTTKDLSHVNVGVKLAGNRPSLKVGDAVSLMKVYEGNTTDATHAVAITSDTPLVNKTTGMQGVSLRYNFDLLTREAEAGSGKNNELYATVTSASVNPDTKSLVETRAASLAFLTSGSDLLTDAAMTAAMEVAATPASESQAGRARVDGAPKEYRMWAVQNVSSMRLNSGSHVDAKGWGLNLGFAKQRVSGRNTLTYGPFVEYGKGSYDSYLDDGLHGSGNMDYLGVGVMAKSQSENGAYVEGSVRVGRVKSDYAGTIDNTHTTYDSSSTYYAGHLGVGQEKQLKNGNTIETYAKYFFTHQGGDTAKLSTGEVYDFDAADSHRIRFGTRYTSKKGDASFYTGLAYEYEFGNDIAASFEGYNTPSPSLTGGTGILELGYRFTPQNGRATYGIQLMGMTGKRRGISGGVQMHWAF